MIIFFTLVNLLFVAFVASMVWYKLAKTDTSIFWSAAVLRLGAGLAVGLLYKYYYSGEGDTFVLFNDAIQVYQGDITTITSEPRSLFFVYIVGFVSIITGNSYWLTSLWLSLFSFICSYRLVVKLDEYFPSLRMASRLALLFVPSVVFWSSGIVKESLAFGAVAILALYFVAFIRHEKITLKAVTEIILALILLLSLKYYWAAVLLPSVIAAFIIRRIAPAKFLAGWFVLVFMLLCLAVSFTHPNFYLSRFLSVMVDNHNLYATTSTSETLIEYYNLSASWISVVINSPWALWSGLFRPLVFEVPTLTGFLAGFENLLILALVAWKIKYIRRSAPENRLIVFTVLVYVITLCVFLALSTPNLGTLSRYRVGFLPFFVLLILADHPILKFISKK